MKQERRLVLLLSVLLLALGWLVFDYTRPYWASPQSSIDNSATFPGANTLYSVKVTSVNPYNAMFQIDYFYNGLKGPTARIEVELPTKPGNSSPEKRIPSGQFRAIPGRHKALAHVRRASSDYDKSTQTQALRVTLKDTKGALLTEKIFQQTIEWPSSNPYTLNSNALKEIERLYELCVRTIDSGNQLGLAKGALEQILLAKPDFVPAYAELARYHMRTNWNEEGRAQAERALKSALRIDPQHANSMVLLGYVYAHQKRFKEAEETLRKAEKIGTPNIWLYTNRGEMYAMQGRMPQAISAYKQAISAPKNLETYERARADAYWRLINILVARKNFKEADELYAQRIQKFPDEGCYKAYHADFRLRKFGDYESAITLGTESLRQGCQNEARKILSMAYYTKGAAVLKSGAKSSDADQYLNRAQVLYAEIPSMLSALASSKYTTPVIPVLKNRGVGVDTSDRNGMTALALSVAAGDLDSTRTLIGQGADVNHRLTEVGLTPLMVAASRGDKAIVALLLRNGADPGARSRIGFTAGDLATQSGFAQVGEMLKERKGI